MPGPVNKWYELQYRTIPAYKYVTGHSHILQIPEFSMCGTIQCIAEQLLYKGVAVLTFRKADTVNDNQADFRVVSAIFVTADKLPCLR